MYSQWYHIVSPIPKARWVFLAIQKFCPFSLLSLHSDPEGCFLFIKVLIHVQKYIFAAIYAPNFWTVSFLSATLKQLTELKEGLVVLGVFLMLP